MLSFWFRTPRSIRLPTKHGFVGIQRVKITRQLRRPAFLMIAGPLATFIVIRSSEYWLPKEFRNAMDGLNQDYEDTKKELEEKQVSAQKKYREYWHKTNKKISQHAKEKDKDLGVGESAGNDELHLTLPIWTRLKQVAPYKHTDKEWQEFVKLQSDDTRMEALFRNIAESMMASFRRRPDSDRILQKIGYTSRINVSLEVLIPYRPPAVFEVPALRVTPRAVELTWRTLPVHYGSKLHRITHPFVFFRAFWVGIQVFCRMSASNMSMALGKAVDKKSTPSMNEVLRGSPKAGDKPAVKNALEENNEQVMDPLKATQKSENKTSIPIYPFDASSVLQSQKDLLNRVSSKSAVKQATIAFQATFMKLQLEALRELPRGACMIEGWVDYLGEYGMIRTQIRIAYLPSKDKFLGEPIVERINIFPHAPAIAAKIEEQKVALAKGSFSAKALVAQHKKERDQEKAEMAPITDDGPAAEASNESLPRENGMDSEGRNSDSTKLSNDGTEKPMDQKLEETHRTHQASQQKTKPGVEKPP